MKKLCVIFGFLAGAAFAHPEGTAVYTAGQLDPLSDNYCPYCVFKGVEAERTAREQRLEVRWRGDLEVFDRLRVRNRERMQRLSSP